MCGRVIRRSLVDHNIATDDEDEEQRSRTMIRTTILRGSTRINEYNIRSIYINNYCCGGYTYLRYIIITLYAYLARASLYVRKSSRIFVREEFQIT